MKYPNPMKYFLYSKLSKPYYIVFSSYSKVHFLFVFPKSQIKFSFHFCLVSCKYLFDWKKACESVVPRRSFRQFFFRKKWWTLVGESVNQSDLGELELSRCPESLRHDCPRRGNSGGRTTPSASSPDRWRTQTAHPTSCRWDSPHLSKLHISILSYVLLLMFELICFRQLQKCNVDIVFAYLLLIEIWIVSISVGVCHPR